MGGQAVADGRIQAGSKIAGVESLLLLWVIQSWLIGKGDPVGCTQPGGKGHIKAVEAQGIFETVNVSDLDVSSQSPAYFLARIIDSGNGRLAEAGDGIASFGKFLKPNIGSRQLQAGALVGRLFGFGLLGQGAGFYEVALPVQDFGFSAQGGSILWVSGQYLAIQLQRFIGTVLPGQQLGLTQQRPGLLRTLL